MTSWIGNFADTTMSGKYKFIMHNAVYRETHKTDFGNANSLKKLCIEAFWVSEDSFKSL